MGLLGLIEAAGEEWSRWAGEHPVRAVLAVVGVLIGSTVTVKRLELPVYKWARDWIFPGRPISQPPVRRTMEVKC